jgi:hypothetical protein
MTGIIECTECGTMSAHLENTTEAQRLPFETSDEKWEDETLLEYACSNCNSEFSVIIPGIERDSAEEELDVYHQMEMAMAGPGWTYSSPENNVSSSGYRTIGFQATRSHWGPSSGGGDFVSRNRRKKTAGIKDIKAASRSTVDCEEYSLTQIDLEL